MPKPVAPAAPNAGTILDPAALYFTPPLAGHNTQYVTEPNPVRPRYWRRETVDGPAVDILEPITILLPPEV